MPHVIVFSTSAPHCNLTDVMITTLLGDAGAENFAGPIDVTGNNLSGNNLSGNNLSSNNLWLAPEKAVQILATDAMISRLDHLRAAGDEHLIDVNIVSTENRRKSLLLADMDSTIITNESLDEMAVLAGLGDAVAAITARSMNGELNFETALDERVAILAGQPASLFEDILRQSTLSPGARVLVQTMRAHGAFCYLVSGGFTPVAGPIADQCGFHAAHANEMDVVDGKLTGTVKKPILGQSAKAEILADYCNQHGLDADQTAAIGDGANDLAALQMAGMGVAYNGKPMLRKAAALQLNHTDLTGLLFLQGYTSAAFVT